VYGRNGASEDAVLRTVFGSEEVEAKVDWKQLYHEKNHTCNSAEIPTRCSFVIEFIIPKFFEG
jgi:hypothetical protein